MAAMRTARWRVRAAAAAAVAAVATAGCYERGARSPARDDAAPPRPPVPGPPAIAPPGGDPTAAADPDAELRVWLEAEPAHLNPLLADALAIRVALGDVYEGLLRRTATGEVEPCLAGSYRREVDDRGRTRWRFTLRSGVVFHDGAPLTAADVVFTYRLLVGPDRAPSAYASAVDDAVSIVAVDDRTVDFVFRGPRLGREQTFASVPVVSARAFAGVSPAAIASAPASRAPVGTGALRAVAWEPGERIVLERFDRYWGAPARARRIVYVIEPSRQRALAALAAGELDVAVQLPVDEAIAAAGGAVRLFAYDAPAYLAAVWNVRRPALRDARVRRALCDLLDRRGVIEQVFRGYARPVDGPLGWTDASGKRAVNVPIAASFAAARRRARVALAAAGAGAPRVELLVPAESRTMRRIADIWAADARPLAHIDVATAPYAAVIERARAGRFDAVLLAFSTGPDADHFDRFHSARAGETNYGGFADAQVDALLEQIRAAPDRAARAELERALAARLKQLQPYCFIATDRRVGLARADVGGIVVTEDGLWARSLWRAR
ncbi:MAG: hypothetical protein D6689_14870 [Deltaproteobacteria bacterium]|nr:MAG: hypothetical protein D6689_14870 [Deltaproteobacteria bacterium]